MTKDIKTIRNKGSANIVLSERFVFDSHNQFRHETKKILEEADIREIEVNFQYVKYMDSAALGMLLLLRENASQANKRLCLTHVKGFVADVLNVANLTKIFEIR